MYEKYPIWMVAASNLLALAVYCLGAAIMYRINNLCLVVYLLYIAALEFRLMSRHCVDCYYYGKLCAFGRGKISCLFFKKGVPEKFSRMKMTWKSMIPDMLVSLVPMAAGIVLLFLGFDWALLAMIILLFLLTTAGNGIVRSKLACKNCKQREMGCPAESLFRKEAAQ